MTEGRRRSGAVIHPRDADAYPAPMALWRILRWIRDEDDEKAQAAAHAEIGAKSVITNLRNAAVVISVLDGARDACINLKPIAMYITDRELQQRAAVVAHVSRAKLEQLRGDLDRFKRRRQTMKE